MCAKILHGQAAYGAAPKHSTGAEFSLGARLYPALPEDRFDGQPLRRDHFILVADVRLDNREDLAAALEVPTSRLQEMADSDLLFEALLGWGDAATDRLIGEFAFALWDESRRTLLLARDVMGHRPLVFHRAENFFAFATMPSGLHALAEVPLAADLEIIAEGLALLPRTSIRTLYRGIDRVLPGHRMRVTREDATQSAYWAAPPLQHRSPREHEEGLRKVIDEAVASQTRGAGDVLGSHLSGGLDSSIVTATAARQFAPGRVIAFTAVPRSGFDGPVPADTFPDEGSHAAETASLCSNVEHFRVEPGEESLTDILERQQAYMQEPTLNLCNSAWDREINRVAGARGVKVMLVGFEGNMTATYSGLEYWSSLFPWRLANGFWLGARLWKTGIPLRTLVAQAIGPLLPDSIWRLACRLYGRPMSFEGYSALNPARVAEMEEKARLAGEDLLDRASTDPLAFRLSVLFDGDHGNYFKGVLAEYGIAIRDPLSDRRVLEYCLSIPPEEYIRGGLQRGLARRAFADRLPASVAQSQLRGYQAADWYERVERDLPLLRAELDRTERCPGAAQIIDTKWLQETLDSWPAGRWAARDVIPRYRYGLLRGISAGHFMRKVAGTN